MTKRRELYNEVTSAWLTEVPMAYHHFDSATHFWDSLAVRYHRPLLRLPALCDGCGCQFSTEHALDCRTGGLVIQRHNEIRDALGDLASTAYNVVARQHIVRKPNDKENTLTALVADLSVHGVWQPQATIFYDVFSSEFLHSSMSTPRNKTTHKLLKSSMHLLHHLS